MKVFTKNGGVVDTENIMVVKIFPVTRRVFSKYKTFYEVWIGLTGDKRFAVGSFDNFLDAIKLKEKLEGKKYVGINGKRRP